MAEKSAASKRRGSRGKSESGGARPRKSGGRVSAGQLAQGAREQVAEITGLDPEGVTSVERSDDGTWKVVVELLELERIPPTDDVLGSYEVQLDEHGDLVGYERVERYTRSQTAGGGPGADRGR